MATLGSDITIFAVGGTGSISWTNPENATSSNDSYVTASFTLSSDTKQLRCTNMSSLSALPDHAEIDNVYLIVEAFETGDAIELYELYAFDGTNRQGNDQLSTPQALTVTETDYTLGSGDWGWWTIARLKNSANGISIRAQKTSGTPSGRIDYVRIQVEYSAPALWKRRRLSSVTTSGLSAGLTEKLAD